MLTSYVQRTVLACFVLATALTGSATAQDYWMYPGGMNSVSLQVFKPNLPEHVPYGEYGFLTSTWVLSAKIRASDNVAVFMSLPASNVVWRWVHTWPYWELPSTDWKETLIGNPYIGLEIGQKDTDQVARPVGRIGIRPPLASDRKYVATYIGAQTLFNSFESVTPDIWTLQLGMGTDLVSRSGVTGSINIDAATLIPTRDGSDSEVFGDYNLAVAYRSGRFGGGFGFAGRIWITEGDMSFGERTTHQLGFVASYQIGSFQPGVHFQVPLDRYLTHYYVDYIYGLSLTFHGK